MLLIVGVDGILDFLQAVSRIRFIDHEDFKTQLAFPTDKLFLIGAQILMTDDQHLGAGNGQAFQVRAVPVIRQCFVSINKGRRKAKGIIHRPAARERKIQFIEREYFISDGVLSIDLHRHTLHFSESKGLHDHNRVRQHFGARGLVIAFGVKYTPGHLIDLDSSFTIWEGKGPADHWSIGKLIPFSVLVFVFGHRALAQAFKAGVNLPG
ncbi:hypothetical protein DSECCO2_451600 [anaerobic digester metagenome]